MTTPGAHFIDDAREADAFLESISGAPLLALDTEGATFHRFFDRVWLIQLATRDRAALLDPTTCGAMPGLAALLASRATEVVIHDAAGDLKSLRRDYGWDVTNVFDTRIAAQLLGIAAFGLGSLLEQMFGVKLDKKMQRADWSMRPLTARMLSYAALDTAHLLALRDRLRSDLEKAGRLAWAEEEFAALERAPAPADDDERAPAFLRVKGARELSRRSLTYFRELVAWREALARSSDTAPFRIIGNEQLLALADDPPRTVADLQRLRGASPGLLAREGQALLDIANRVRAMPEVSLAVFPQQTTPRDPAYEARLGKLKIARDAAAAKAGLDPGFLCGRARLELVLARAPKSLDDLADAGLRRWHIEVMGRQLLEALASHG